MKYDVYLSPRANKQYKRFDAHIRHKIRTELLELEEDPYKKGSLLQGVDLGLRYIKIFHDSVQYRAVYRYLKRQKRSSGYLYRFTRKLL